MKLGDRILKVNHAGEQGAINIYSGQIMMARLTARDLVPMLAEFREHERRHRSIFWAELERRGRPRCKSYWLCALGGFALDLLTGLLGRSAIAATTVAVERVVLGHLKQQIVALNGIDTSAVDAITAIVEDEQHHHDQSVAHVSDGNFWMKALFPLVAASTESVIWLGMHL